MLRCRMDAEAGLINHAILSINTIYKPSLDHNSSTARKWMSDRNAEGKRHLLTDQQLDCRSKNPLSGEQQWFPSAAYIGGQGDVHVCVNTINFQIER